MENYGVFAGLIGGLGLFLFGMKMMGDGLENAAGEKLKGILEKITSNKYIGVVVGAVVTAVIQSSSATTVMVVSFVNAGLMSLMQATGVIMGANIGTTITAQMVSFNLDGIAPFFIGFGAILLLTVKNKRARDIASIALGFGILFMGMGLMSSSMSPVAESDTFRNLITVIGDNRILGVLAGLGMTAIVQSSSATTGILVALAMTGSIDMNIALPIIFGCNIGTCVTALLASLGANRTAKKAALIHLMFNIVGVIVFLPFMDIVINIVEKMNPGEVTRQVANAHTIFNVTVTILLLPMAKYLVVIANKILPGDELIQKKGAMYLDKNLLETPVIASGQVFKETIRMADIAKENIELAMKSFLEDNEESIKKVYENEEVINILERDITDYLVLLSSYELPEKESRVLSSTFHVINDIERIGDHAKNIVELSTEKINNHLTIEGEAKDEIINMYEKTIQALNLALDCYSSNNSIKAKEIKEIECSINKYEKDLRENNIIRLNERKCTANSSVVFLDLINNLERIGDHSTNIAESIR